MPITIRGMLTHTSSIVNAGDSTSRAYSSVRNKLQSGGYSGAVPGDIGYWPGLYGREGIYFHTGSAYGVFNCACYDPATGDGVVVLTVGASGAKDDYGIYKVCAEINGVIYDMIW